MKKIESTIAGIIIALFIMPALWTATFQTADTFAEINPETGAQMRASFTLIRWTTTIFSIAKHLPLIITVFGVIASFVLWLRGNSSSPF